jgi:hypothetical protein
MGIAIVFNSLETTILMILNLKIYGSNQKFKRKKEGQTTRKSALHAKKIHMLKKKTFV